MPRVLIIGGGLAGLTAAFRLRDRFEVTVLEASSRLGGQIETTQEHGFLVERGGEGFVARSQAVPALASDLDMADELIGQAVFGSYGFDGTRLARLSPGEAAQFLGFQVPVEDLGKGIRSLRRGMGSLIDALQTALRDSADLRVSSPVLRVAADARGVCAHTESTRFDTDALILATTAAASTLLTPLTGEPGSAPLSAATLSSVTVELAYPRDAILHALDGTGFVVAVNAQQAGLRACTFTSQKFIDRASSGEALLRLFFRPSDDDLGALDDRAFIERACAGLSRVLTVRGVPIFAWVSRWPNALPVFSDQHRAEVAQLETALTPYPIALAGSAFHGAGIDAAVGSGEQAARAIASRL